MAGMLSQAQQGQSPPQQQPSSGPDMQTPPEAVSGAENPPRDGATGPGQPQNVQDLINQAIKLIYGERFDQLIKMFETNGVEGFPRSMAITINTAFTELEKANGPIPLEQIAEVGMQLMLKLMEDIISKGVLPEVTLKQTQQVLPATLVMFADSHPEVSKQQVQELVELVTKGAAEHDKGGAVEPAPEAAPSPPPEGAI